MNKIIGRASLVVPLLILCACMSTPPPPMTAEQQAQVEELKKAYIQRLKLGTQKLQAQQQLEQQKLQTASIATIDSSELLAEVDNVIKTGGPALFKVERDGILINNTVYLDPEGTVERAGWNILNGHFTYVISNFDGSKTVKFSRANTQAAPITIAQIRSSNNGHRVDTVDGQTLVGKSYIPTSGGIIASRGASLFKYEIGKPVESISVPRGWSVASWQRGDVDSTGLVLLEKNKSAKTQQKQGIGGLFSSFKEIGKDFGITEIYDYALLDIKSGRTFLLNMSINDKAVTKLTNCQRQNSFVNKCSDSYSYNSLYEADGRANRLHYFWALDWFQTLAGPMAIYNSGSSVVLIDITSSQNIKLYERTLGVNGFIVEKQIDGKVKVVTQLGFDEKTIEDLAQHMAGGTFENSPVKSI